MTRRVYDTISGLLLLLSVCMLIYIWSNYTNLQKSFHDLRASVSSLETKKLELSAELESAQFTLAQSDRSGIHLRNVLVGNVDHIKYIAVVLDRRCKSSSEDQVRCNVAKSRGTILASLNEAVLLRSRARSPADFGDLERSYVALQGLAEHNIEFADAIKDMDWASESNGYIAAALEGQAYAGMQIGKLEAASELVDRALTDAPLSAPAIITKLSIMCKRNTARNEVKAFRDSKIMQFGHAIDRNKNNGHDDRVRSLIINRDFALNDPQVKIDCKL